MRSVRTRRGWKIPQLDAVAPELPEGSFLGAVGSVVCAHNQRTSGFDAVDIFASIAMLCRAHKWMIAMISNKTYMQRTPISIGINLSCLARHQAHGPLARVPQKSLFTEGFYPAHGVNRCSRIRGNSGSPWWRFCYSVYIRNQRRRRAFYFHRAFPERRIYCVMSSGNAADVAQTLNLFRVCSFSRSLLDKN